MKVRINIDSNGGWAEVETSESVKHMSIEPGTCRKILLVMFEGWKRRQDVGSLIPARSPIRTRPCTGKEFAQNIPTIGKQK